jgi:prephenate dehydrogenase
MMMDILVANRDNILGMLSVAETKMKRLSTLLESKDYDELRIMLSGIKSCRSKLN